MLVRRFENLNEGAGAGSHPFDNGLQEAVATFGGLFTPSCAIKIEFAHEDLRRSEGQSAAWRLKRWAVNFWLMLTVQIIPGGPFVTQHKTGLSGDFK